MPRAHQNRPSLDHQLKRNGRGVEGGRVAKSNHSRAYQPRASQAHALSFHAPREGEGHDQNAYQVNNSPVGLRGQIITATAQQQNCVLHPQVLYLM